MSLFDIKSIKSTSYLAQGQTMGWTRTPWKGALYPMGGCTRTLHLAVYLAWVQTHAGSQNARFYSILHHFTPISDPFWDPDSGTRRPLFRGPLYQWGSGPDLKRTLKTCILGSEKRVKNGDFLTFLSKSILKTRVFWQKCAENDDF